MNKNDIFEEGFFNEYNTDFEEYFENHRFNKILQIPKYKDFNKKICRIKEGHPNVIAFLEDNELTDLDKEDKEAILKIIELHDELIKIEIKEAFKLGFKEAYIYFESMDMLSI